MLSKYGTVKAQLVGTSSGEAVYLDSGGQPSRLLSLKVQ